MLPVRRVSGLLALVLLSAAAVIVLWSRHVYKQWPWSSYPNPLHRCGRDYTPEGAQTLTQIRRLGSRDFHKASDLPGWLNHGEVWTIAQGADCLSTPLAYWVRLGDDRFEFMSLEGSP